MFIQFYAGPLLLCQASFGDMDVFTGQTPGNCRVEIHMIHTCLDSRQGTTVNPWNWHMCKQSWGASSILNKPVTSRNQLGSSLPVTSDSVLMGVGRKRWWQQTGRPKIMINKGTNLFLFRWFRYNNNIFNSEFVVNIWHQKASILVSPT